MERWRRINELFHAAVALSAGERTLFLKDACAGDLELFREVEQLILAHQGAGNFIQRLPVTNFLDLLGLQESRVPTGRQIGAYKIVKEIGRGGMGTVFLAERADTQYRKQVAIKLIRPGMEADNVLRQFRNERQILATLEHPHIARLLDGGTTEEGMPYFVMEYIDGLPIDRYCHQHRLTVTARLMLFRQVCSAVSYAHRHLVVHRDIKPSNIFVTKEGVPKLLDFGIAKILEGGSSFEAGSTVTGLQVMTPEYASPEQIQGGHATTLSDVYSLGVVLYELLVGRAPYRFKGSVPHELAQAISTAEPEKPSDAVTRPEPSASARTIDSRRAAWICEGSPDRLRRRLRGDLDNIILMALRKEPHRRYLSVEQFSDDIGCHLAGHPVRARSDTLGYRGAKFIRRNRVTVAASALLFLTLVGGILATSWQAHRARAHEGIARAEQARAERRFNDVRKLARSVLFDYHDAIKDLPGATPVRSRFVRDALEYLDRLAGEANNDVSLKIELAAAYERVGEVQGGTMAANLGDTAGAIESLRKALRIRESIPVSGAADLQIRRDLALTYYKLGGLLWETGDMDAALQNNRKTLALVQLLADENPADLDIRRDLVSAHDQVGMILVELGDVDGALKTFRKQLSILESFPTGEKRSERIRRSFSVAYEHIGAALLQAGDLANALDNNRKALALRSALSAEFPHNADYRRTVLVSHYNDGEILAKMGRTREALESYRKDLAIAEELFSADPQNEQYRGDQAFVLIRIGDMLARLGRHSGALANYRKSREIRSQDVKADPPNLWKRCSLIEAHAKIAKTLAQAGQASLAVKACAETVRWMEGTVIEPTNANFRRVFADVYTDLGEAYVLVASNKRLSLKERRELWRLARDMYGRSAEIWEDLTKRGIMVAFDAGKLEAVAREIALCEMALK